MVSEVSGDDPLAQLLLSLRRGRISCQGEWGKAAYLSGKQKERGKIRGPNIPFKGTLQLPHFLSLVPTSQGSTTSKQKHGMWPRLKHVSFGGHFTLTLQQTILTVIELGSFMFRKLDSILDQWGANTVSSAILRSKEKPSWLFSKFEELNLFP